jgi:hypothetical protein
MITICTRDAVGEYRLGLPTDPIRLTFALEAKRYQKSGVGVHELARLISRLRHREFGVLVTTSYVSRQAYTEIRDDQHPIIVISAADYRRHPQEARYPGCRCSTGVAEARVP